MMASQRQWRGFKLGFGDAKIGHEAIMQAAFHNDGQFGGLSELNHRVSMVGLGTDDGQSAAISEQIVCILYHIMHKRLLAECACGQFLVERQLQSGLVQIGIACPNFLRKRHGGFLDECDNESGL